MGNSVRREKGWPAGAGNLSATIPIIHEEEILPIA
jgi:hypothetical protein